MELDRAKAIADVARVIVDSAKAEVQFLQVAERVGGAMGRGTGFIPVGDEEDGHQRPRLAGTRSA